MAPENPVFLDEERFSLYRLCPCKACEGVGKLRPIWEKSSWNRCDVCRGEGRVLGLVATAGTPEAVGMALITLAREGEFEDCPLGLLDGQGEAGKRWLIRPWQPSPRNASDAGKLLRALQTK